MLIQELSHKQLQATLHGVSIRPEGVRACKVVLTSHRAANVIAAQVKHCYLLQIVFNTDQSVGNLADCLAYIYSNLYVEYVMKNPLYEPGQPFR